MQDNLRKSVEQLKELQMDFNTTVETKAQESEDIKEDQSTIEEKKREPENVLFNGIIDNTVNILQNPIINKSFEVMAKDMSADSVSALVNIVAIAMTYSSYQAIVFYDDLLKQELVKQFENVGKYINAIKADQEGQGGAIKIIRNQINEIVTKFKIDEIKENI